jgi:hypothetical protein
VVRTAKNKKPTLKVAATKPIPRGSERALGLDHACGDQILPAQFQDYPRERFGRWAAEDGAIGGGENSAVAGTRENVFLRSIKYWAGCVGAEATEREERAFRWMQQEARMLVIRVGDDFHAADGHVSRLGDNFDRIGIFPRANEGDESAECCSDTGGS